jgi:hypothetical protein
MSPIDSLDIQQTGITGALEVYLRELKIHAASYFPRFKKGGSYRLKPGQGECRTWDEPVSTSGQKQTSRAAISISALPPKADIVQHGGNVRFVPQADIGRGLFDHFIGKPKNRRWYFKTDGFRGLQIYHEHIVCWFLER